jgi:hypothetical protein
MNHAALIAHSVLPADPFSGRSWYGFRFFFPRRRLMSQRGSERRDWRKNQRVKRETLDEIQEEARDREDYAPRYQDVNRDRFRGDWDRTGRRHDEERTVE